MGFNSLDAQRESCEAYIASQRAEGWLLVNQFYDDGGFSGGTLERPALQKLLADIERGLIDVVVVYKIDRLSRSLMDFAKLVEAFDRHAVTFVSVTQAFSTTTSMGRLTLNVLLSFAQFEREVIGERIRDKVAASRKRGIWMGGNPPMGYRVQDRKLVEDADAATVRMIFERFAASGSATTLAHELRAEGVRTRTGKLIDKGYLYKLINNQAYIGMAVHKGVAYPGEHAPLIDRAVWDRTQAILNESPRVRANRTRSSDNPALLKGLLFGPGDEPLTPTSTRRRGRLYRYYVAASVLKIGPHATSLPRVPAGEIEAAVVEQLKLILTAPETIVHTWLALYDQDPSITEAAVRDALFQQSALWDELFPAEQARIVQLLVARVDLDVTGASVRLRADGLAHLAREVAAAPPATPAAERKQLAVKPKAATSGLPPGAARMRTMPELRVPA